MKKNRILILKSSIKNIIEDKEIWQIACLSLPIGIYIILYSVMIILIWDSSIKMIHETIKFFKNKNTEDISSSEKSVGTKMISSDDFNGNIVLTSEVDIDSDEIFKEIIKTTDHDFTNEIDSNLISEVKEISNDVIASEVDAGVHAHVQSLKNQSGKSSVEDKIHGAKEAEKSRLEALKAKMIHTSDNKEIDNSTLSQADKLNILKNLGYISPTRGRIKEYIENTKEKTVEETTQNIFDTEEFIVSSVEPIEEIEEHNELISDIAVDFMLMNSQELKNVTEEFELTLEENIEKTIETTLELTTTPLIETLNHSIDKKESESNSLIGLSELIDENIKKESKTSKYKEKKDFCLEYNLPNLKLLSPIPINSDLSGMKEEVQIKSQQIDEMFENFKVGAKVSGHQIGPTVTTYEVEITPGTKIAKITGLEDNIKLQLQAKSIRIQAPIPGRSVIGIEVPNIHKKLVTFHEVWKQSSSTKSDLLVAAGQDVNGKVMTFDLAKTPHMLIAGSTGSGKSVAINTVLISLMMNYTPKEVQMILVDPKMVEFMPYHNIPHLITPVITNPSDANIALKESVNIMEERYKLMAENGARNIAELNKKLKEQRKESIPYLVIIVDELADLMMVAAKEVEESIMRITQKARAAGIHMIVATQRPSTDVITGVIKSNIPSRIAFTVASSIDSRTILDQTGAEKLIGMGDMLMSLYGQLPIRGQGAYISSEEVEKITNNSKSHCKPNYKIDIKHIIENSNTISGPQMDETDQLYLSAKQLVIKQRKASTSLIQRYLSVGYNKAANIIDALESNGVIGPSNGSKPREVLISKD